MCRCVQSREPRERGSAVLEFALCGLFMAPLLLGVTGVGLALVRDIQVQQVARDAGHMFAQGVDFSPAQTANRTLLARISRGLGITESSTSKAIILTKVQFVTELDCANPMRCANKEHYAIAKRVVLGDSTNIKSSFGEPQQPDGSGDVPPDVISNNAADRVDPFPPAIANLWQKRKKQNGQIAYVAEVVVTSSDLAWTGFAGPYTKATAIF